MSPENFSHGLRSRIRARHDGDLPSASELARALNQADQWRRPVSAETMRRWIRGLSLPELHRVPALCQWLDCSPGDLFVLASAESPADAAPGRLQQAGASNGDQHHGNGFDRQGARHQDLCARIGRLLPDLTLAELESLLVLLERQPPADRSR